jgi:DeoR/GlpR family transcriptional regulator of sugar metabolism
MLLLDRHLKIIQIIAIKGSVKVSELSKEFGVTEETIRRDLEKLEKEGYLKRTHGGAVCLEADVYNEVPYQIRSVRNVKEKKLIGEVAAGMIEPGDVIILDASTTALQVASIIKKNGLKDVTVLTNAINVALKLANQPKITLICTGGILREQSLSFVGPLAEKNLQNYYVKKAFISCKGVSLAAGLTDADELQAKLKSEMIKISQKVYLLADHDKFEKTAFAPVAPITAVYNLITDEGTPVDMLEKYIEAGIEVIVAQEKMKK